MGQIFKYILVALILYYLWNNHLKKMINVFFKGSSTSSGNNRSSNDTNQQGSYRKEEPKVTARSQNTSAASGKDFKGGEYVDFEEVE